MESATADDSSARVLFAAAQIAREIVFPKENIMMRTIITLIMLACSAQAFAAPAERLLPNGVRLILIRDTANPVVASFIVVRAGLAWEGAGESGASHFLEHLLFNGTSRRTQEQLYAETDRLGIYNNATTREDHTLYLMLGPRERLSEILDLQSDMLLHSTLPADKFEKERGIVLEEMRHAHGDPSGVADELFTERLYAGTAYARPVLGTPESIGKITRASVSAYYRDRYRPSRMTVMLRGDFDPAAAVRLVEERFGAGPAAAPDTDAAEARIDWTRSPRIFHAPLPGTNQFRMAFPAPPPGAQDAPAFEVLAALLDDAESGPLAPALRGGPAPAAESFSVSYDQKGGASALIVSATLTGAQPAAAAAAAVSRAMTEFAAAGPSRARVRAARDAARNSDILLADNLLYYGMAQAPALSLRGAEGQAAYDRALAAVDFGAVSAAAASLAKLLPLAFVAAPGEASTDTVLAVPQAPAARAADTPARRDVLPNRLTVLSSSRSGAPVFSAHLLFRDRSSREPDGRAGIAELVHRLFLRGTAARSAGGLSLELAILGAQVKVVDDPNLPFDDYYTGPDYSWIRLECPDENAQAALFSLREILSSPRSDPAELARIAGEISSLAKRQGASPREAARKAFREAAYGTHPFARPVLGTGASLDGVTSGEAAAFRAAYIRPSNMILSVSGSAPAAELLAAVRAAFADWADPGGAPPPTLPAPVTLAPVRKEVAVGKPQGALLLGAVVEVAPADRAALWAAVNILSDRLAADLREKQGLAYSVGAGLSDLGNGRMLVTASMGTTAENMEKAESAIRGHVKSMTTEQVPEEERTRVIAAATGRALQRRLPSINRAYLAGLREFRGMPGDGDREMLEGMRAASSKDLRAAAKRYLVPDRWITVVVR